MMPRNVWEEYDPGSGDFVGNNLPVLLSSTGAVLAVMDDFSSIKWTRRYMEADEFEMEIPSLSSVAKIIAPDMVVIAPDDPAIAFLVEQIDVEISGRASVMVLSGRSMDGALGEPGRIAIPPAGSSHDVYTAVAAETVMKDLVSKNAGAAAIVARRLPSFNVIASGSRGGAITLHARYQPVLELLGAIAKTIDEALGWEVEYNFSTRQHNFDVIVPTNRSATVILDAELDAVTGLQWHRTQADYASYAYVAGQGQGAARTIVERSIGSPTGLARKEIFVDARDLSNTTALSQRGDAELKEKSVQTGYKIDMNLYGPFRYRLHFNLGDLVTVRNQDWNISAVARIISVEQTINDSSLIPNVAVEVGRVAPTIFRRAQDRVRRVDVRD